MFALTAGEGALLVVVLVLALGGLYLLAVSIRTRRLEAAANALDAAWMRLEAVLVHHHAAAENLVGAADEHNLVAERQRELIEHAVADASRTGEPEDRAQRESRLHTVVSTLDRVLLAAAVPVPVRAAQRAYHQAWDEVRAAGARYDRLVPGYNRLTGGPLVVLGARRLGRVRAERFRPAAFSAPDQIGSGSVDAGSGS